MKIEIPYSALKEVRKAIYQFRIRHGPFNKLDRNRYRIYLYPSNKISLFLIKVSSIGISVLE